MIRKLLILVEVPVECGDHLCVECDKWVPTEEGRWCVATSELIENGMRTVACHKAEKRAKEMAAKTRA